MDDLDGETGADVLGVMCKVSDHSTPETSQDLRVRELKHRSDSALGDLF